MLDLFCGAGGAAMGLHRAWPDAEITGVDIDPQPNYPFTFVQDDAMTYPLEPFDFVWASPPCQAFTQLSAKHRGKGGLADARVDLLTPMRARLARVSVPWVLENVPGARRHMRHLVTLHGGMFGLGVHRPRLFEANFLILAPQASPTVGHVGVYGRQPDGRRLWDRADGSIHRAAKSLAEGSAAMGIDWMGWRELAEAIPPAYSQYIARFAPVYERAA